MVKVVVTGISLRSCLGNKEDTWRQLIQGISGIKISQPFIQFSPLPLGLIGSAPTHSDLLTEELIADLCDDGIIKHPCPEMGIVVGSSRGCQSRWEDLLSKMSQPSQTDFNPPWLDTLAHHQAILCANYLGTRGIVNAPSNACATGLVAIAQGYELIQQGRCSQVVVGAVETPITPLTLAGFNRMKALAPKHCDPFGCDRNGFVLGEGGAMLLLETETSALKRRAKIYGQIFGWGMSCDADALTAPEADGQTAIAAIAKCLSMAQLKPSEIDYIHAHGTGTVLNDRREAKIINQLFPHTPYISSSKGAIAHTLGASGAIATALNFISLEQQMVIPNLAHSPCEFSVNLCQQATPYPLQKMLAFSFGFGGQNAVLAMGIY